MKARIFQWSLHYWPFVLGIHWEPVVSPQKRWVMQKECPYHDGFFHNSVWLCLRSSGQAVKEYLGGGGGGGRNSPLFSPAISSATNVNTAMNTYKLWSIHHTETSLLPHEQAAFTGTMAEQTTQALQVSTNTVPSSVSHSRMDQRFANLIDWLDQISFYVLPSRTAYCNTSNLSFANKFQANASSFLTKYVQPSEMMIFLLYI